MISDKLQSFFWHCCAMCEYVCIYHLQVANARLEATLVNYESGRNQLEAAQLQKLQAMAERDEYMGRTLALQQKLLDKEEVLSMCRL